MNPTRLEYEFVLLAGLFFGTVVGSMAGDKIETFRLETMDRSVKHGPFELGTGQRVLIEGQAYTVVVGAAKKIRFQSLTTGAATDF